MRRCRLLIALLASAVLAAAAVSGTASPGFAGSAVNHGANRTTFALLGDTPYGADQREQFPALVDEINDDPKVRFVLHAGDVKNGSSLCSDALFADRVALYDAFEDPFVLTPGDNEWTDCHRVAAGSYLPTERLDALRELFYPVPGGTLGRRPMQVRSQADSGAHTTYRENVLFQRGRVVFSTVHVVGSENDLEPWTGLPGGDRPEVRLAEFDARLAAALAWIEHTFATAQANDAAGVLLMMQAEPTGTPGFAEIRQLVVERARAFGRPVLLVHGDEHQYEQEPSYAGVDNLTRLETFGDTAMQWLRVTVDVGDPGVFSWTPESL